jgi:thymidylate synthase
MKKVKERTLNEIRQTKDSHYTVRDKSHGGFSRVFKENLQYINGETSPRGLKVKEKIFGQMTIDPLRPIADFESRPFNWKYFAGELAWYLKKDRDIDYINNFSSFWKGITNPGTNEINSNYGSLVFNEQLNWVVDSLVKDRDSRQAIMFFNKPEFQFEGNKDFVCTMYANFFIRDNKLHMKVQMRSNDMFYGLTFDAPFFSFLHQSVYRLVWSKRMKNGGNANDEVLELGNYYHFADNLHFYERHFDLADKIIDGDKYNNYSLKLKYPWFSFEGDEICMTVEALTFLKEIDMYVNSSNFKDLDQNHWKSIIEDYFII